MVVASFPSSSFGLVAIDLGVEHRVGAEAIRPAFEKHRPLPVANQSGRILGGTLDGNDAARKAAEQLHVNLDSVDGRGPDGSITVADVERAASRGRTPSTPSTPASPDRAAGMRSAIAAAMTRAKREIPHLSIFRQPST